MTDLDKLEAALMYFEPRILVDDWNKPSKEQHLEVLKEAARAHLAAQRQAPEDRAAVDEALKDFDYMERFIDGGVHPYVKNDFMRRKSWETIRAALANSVPGDVLERVHTALMISLPVFTLPGSKKKFHTLKEKRELIEAHEKALRDLAPWVKGVG